MNIKQTIRVFSLAAMVAVGFSFLLPSAAFALSKDNFASILCDDFQGPSTSGGTLADDCRKDAKDGTLSKHWYNKVIKYSDWKNKSTDDLYKFIGKEPPTPPSGATEKCGGVDTAIISCSASGSGDLKDNGIWALLLMVINIMTAGVGVLAVGGIVYGAILYTTAEDKADQVKKATDIITNVIIGLILFAMMWAGLNFLIPGGVFAA